MVLGFAVVTSPLCDITCWSFRSETEVDGVVVGLVHCSQSGTVALQLEDGQLRKLIWGQSAGVAFFSLNIYAHNVFRSLCFNFVFPIVQYSRADSPEPSVEVWRDSSGCAVNFPVPCTQVSLCSISGEVRRWKHSASERCVVCSYVALMP